MAALSQREFAKLLGVSHVQVNRAINSGRLKRGVNAAGKVTDPEAARAEYEATLDLTRAAPHVHEAADRRRARAAQPLRGEDAHAGAEAPPGDGRPQPVLGAGLTENNAVKAYWQALHEELDFRKAAGALVPAADVDARVRNAFHVTRTKLLTLPSRAKTALGLSASQVLKLEALTREMLEELAAGKATS